jgi:hypothetical protein
MPEKNGDHPISILLIIIHGLIRARDLELGRDADTGGQTKYVAGFGSDPSNGMDRSCAATIYPVLDKPRSTGFLGAQGPQSTGDISARFSGSLYDWPR